MPWRELVAALLASLLPEVRCIPQFLKCGSDQKTRMRPGQKIMKQDVGGTEHMHGHIKMTLLRTNGTLHHVANHKPASFYYPGEVLMVHAERLPLGCLFAIRISDGGGRIDTAPPPSAQLTNRCDEQVYATKPPMGEHPDAALITTPCEDAPETITVTLIAAANSMSPVLFTSAMLQRGEGRDPHCDRIDEARRLGVPLEDVEPHPIFKKPTKLKRKVEDAKDDGGDNPRGLHNNGVSPTGASTMSGEL